MNRGPATLAMASSYGWMSHWWTFVTVVPFLVAVDHGVRWWGELTPLPAALDRTGGAGVAPLLRVDTWLTGWLPDGLPGQGALHNLIAFLSVGVVMHAFTKARREGLLVKIAWLLAAAGVIGHWFDRVLLMRLTVPIRFAGLYGQPPWAFSLGDLYLVTSLFCFAAAGLRAKTPPPAES